MMKEKTILGGCTPMEWSKHIPLHEKTLNKTKTVPKDSTHFTQFSVANVNATYT